MFRKLMRMETEAMLRQASLCEDQNSAADEASRAYAGEVAYWVPSLPQRFGVCASGVG